MALPKIDRDYNVFGKYVATIGVRLWTGSSYEAFNEAEIKYTLEEPAYDAYEETSFSERQYTMLKYKDFDIDVANTFDMEGRGSQTIMAELITSKSYTEDDILRMTFYIDLPSKLMSEDTVVYQWAQLLLEGDTYGTDAMIGIGCAAVMGNTTEIQHVYNFDGTSSLQSGAGITDTVFNQTLVDEEVPSFSAIFADYNETWAYEDWQSGVEGNMVKSCVADMKIPKQNRDESVFSNYIIHVGAHLYDSWSATSAKATKQQKTKFSLSEPDYSAEFVDETTLNLFVDENNSEATEKEIIALGQASAAIDTSATLGVSGSAQQFFYVAQEVSKEISESDFISLYFSVDLPESKLVEGAIIYQWANLMASGQTSLDDTISVSCQVTVGDFSAVKVREYFGTTSLDAATQGTNKVNEQATADLVIDSNIQKREDEQFYALQNSTLDMAKNKVQPCIAQIPLNKLEDNSAIYTTYTVSLGARIYTDKSDTSPINLGESTTEVTITEPTYTSDWSEYDTFEYGEIEAEWIEVGSTSELVADTTAALSVAGEGSAFVYSDVEVNKDFTIPNFWTFWFYTSAPADAIPDGSSVFQWITLTPSSGSPKTIGCMTTVNGETATERIFEWEGASTFDDNAVGTGTSIDTLYSGEYSQTLGVRSTYQEYDYWTYTYDMPDANGGADVSIRDVGCTARIDIPKVGASSALWTTYTTKNGVKIFESDLTTYKTLVDDVAGSFEVTEITNASYEFGDDYEFNEDVSESDVFSESETFEMSALVDGTSGTGFMKIAGGFVVVPNFETALWYFRFQLEMPTEYFNSENVLYAEITVEPTDQAFPPQTVVCATGIDAPEDVMVLEFDENFVSASSGDATIDGQNAANFVASSDWGRDWDMEKYALVAGLNGKSRQSCVAKVEVAPEEADYFFDKEYDVTVEGRIYDSWTSENFVQTQSYDYVITVPAADFTFKEPDFVVKDVQIAATESFSYKNELNVSGKATQWFETGFEVNPYDDTANDSFGFWWTLDAPTEAIPDGSIVYQYVSFIKSGSTSKFTTVGCATTVGDPYVARIDTFNGTSSMAATSTVVAGKTWTEQNTEEKARKSVSFKLGAETVWYKKMESATSANTVIPCLAMREFEGKLAADSDFFGDYEMTIGARVYADEFDTAPKTIPSQTFSVTLGEPQSDLAALYEEDEPEESSEILESFSELQRFKNELVFPSEFTSGDDAWSYQLASGGYKLYNSKSATERWYWDLALIMPEKYFTDGRIMYQWITYADTDLTPELTGAIACKTVVGDVTATQVDQWQGVTDLLSTSDAIKGKKWYKQQRDGKMTEPEYRALFWNDIFNLVDAPDRTGYKVQHCQAEIEIAAGALPDDVTIDMQIGARFYANDDAVEFESRDGKAFDWYNQVLSYSAKYEIEPVYDITTAKGKVEAAITNDPVVLSTLSQARKDDYQAAYDAEVAAAAAAELAAQQGGLAIVEQNSRQSADITATSSVGHGWTIYENEVESDYWWWYVATDMGDSLMSDGEILYQWVTMIDQSADYTEDPFTIGCAITKGVADTYTVQVFTHTTSPDTTTYLQSDADPSVVGQKWAEQNADEINVLSDTAWTAGTAHHGSNVAPDSTESLNTNFACYFAREYAKIGRNPNDFNKDFEVTIGSRLYANDDATTFDSVPSPAAFTVTLTEPDSYNTQTTGAFSLFASSLAAVAMLLALAF